MIQIGVVHKNHDELISGGVFFLAAISQIGDIIW